MATDPVMDAIYPSIQCTDPLDVFFINHFTFFKLTYDPLTPCLELLKNLQDHLQLAKKTTEWIAIDRSFWIAMIDCFTHYYGDSVDDLVAWQKLWRVIGFDAQNFTTAEYRMKLIADDEKAFAEIHVNVIDIIDATRGCHNEDTNPAPIFPTTKARKQYSRQARPPKIFPLWYALGGHKTEERAIVVESVPGVLGIVLGDISPTDEELGYPTRIDDLRLTYTDAGAAQYIQASYSYRKRQKDSRVVKMGTGSDGGEEEGADPAVGRHDIEDEQFVEEEQSCDGF